MLQKSTTLKTLKIAMHALTMKQIGQLLKPNHPAFPAILDFKGRNLKGGRFRPICQWFGKEHICRKDRI